MSEEEFGYIPKLPEVIRDTFKWLCQDVASLTSKWNFYLELFDSEDNTRLLSELVPASFNIIEESLRNDMTMAICRLSDPSQSVGKDNLSIAALVQKCAGISDLDKLFESFQTTCQPVRRYRNKRVGHNDLNTTIKPRQNPLPGIGQEQINKILELASQILNTVVQNFDDTEMYFHPFQIDGTDTLIFLLKKAKNVRRGIR